MKNKTIKILPGLFGGILLCLYSCATKEERSNTFIETKIKQDSSMMKSYFFILCLVCLGIFSCKQKQAVDNAEKLILFDSNKSLDEFDMASIMDTTFQIIPLEMNENCLVFLCPVYYL